MEGQGWSMIETSHGHTQLSLKERIENLWTLKESESSIIAEGRTIPSDEDREQDALNWAFQRIPVALFPHVPGVIELSSDTSLGRAISIFSHHHIQSAPVRHAGAGDEQGWLERYMGIVDYSAIVLYVLGVAEIASTWAPFGDTSGGSLPGSAAVVTAGSEVQDPELKGSKRSCNLPIYTAGDFFQSMKKAGMEDEVKMSELCGTFRWGPFVPISPDDNLLTLLLLLSKHRVKSLPMVDTGKPGVLNIITQSSVVDLLAECTGLAWFDHKANRTLESLGLPTMQPQDVIKVEDSSPVMEPFVRMAEHNIGGVAVVEKGTNKLIANISARDIRFLITNPDKFDNERHLTVKDFIDAVQTPSGTSDEHYPVICPPITCQVTESLNAIIQRLKAAHIHRTFVIDSCGNVIGVVTLRDIIGKFVYEPANYFDDFFTEWGSTVSK